MHLWTQVVFLSGMQLAHFGVKEIPYVNGNLQRYELGKEIQSD